jgi:hypothetical protein
MYRVRKGLGVAAVALFALGCGPVQLNQPFQGKIDEVRFYNVALTPAQVALLP